MQQQPASVTNSLFGNEVVDALVLFQSLLYVDEKIDAVNHGLNKLHLRITETVWVGDVKSASDGCCVNPTWNEKTQVSMLNENQMIISRALQKLTLRFLEETFDLTGSALLQSQLVQNVAKSWILENKTRLIKITQ